MTRGHAGHRKAVRPLARPQPAGDDQPMAQAVVLVLLIVVVLRLTWGRANTAARLAAIGAVFLFIWVAVALVDVSSAAKMAGWTATGFAVSIHGLANFIGQL